MKQLVRCLAVLGIWLAQHASAAEVVRIGNGDCASLVAAAGAAPGSEPALILLARGGTYTACTLNVVGKVEIDGAGALLVPGGGEVASTISVATGASLTLRNTRIGPAAAASPTATGKHKAGVAPKFCCTTLPPVISNAGSLKLDADSFAGNELVAGLEQIAPILIQNKGSLFLRNSSLVGNTQVNGAGVLNTNGPVEISHSTLVTTPQAEAGALLTTYGSGSITLANSIVINNGSIASDACDNEGGTIVSRGGNVFGDESCGGKGLNDRVVPDLHALDFGLHGGVVGTLALDTNSPALNNGLAANCEATDARGLARSTQTCDAGAIEIGGGNGKLSASGMSGLYFNAANNGHYVSVQRLYGDNALVIWNTFDEHGVPAWLYGVGSVANGKIHVAQVAQNVGGTLHSGGSVSGATPTLWGTFDFTLGDCFNASLSYSSPNAAFGSGATPLQRLAFVDGLDCQH